MLKIVRNLIACAALLIGAQSAFAGVMYDVSNATKACGVGHGLWTNQQYTKKSSCGNHFAIEAWLKLYEDGGEKKGHLWGTAKNSQGHVAKIDIWMSNWASEGAYKQEGGAEYSDEKHDFFLKYGGTITISKGDRSRVWDVSPYGFNFQYGMGASAKGADYMGASAWLQACTEKKGEKYCPQGHWDLNLKLTKKVPEPSTLALLGLGLAGLGIARRRKAA